MGDFCGEIAVNSERQSLKTVCVVGKEEELILIPLSGCGYAMKAKGNRKIREGESLPQVPIEYHCDGKGWRLCTWAGGKGHLCRWCLAVLFKIFGRPARPSLSSRASCLSVRVH